MLRFHLDQCDDSLRSMYYPGLYPAIFQSKFIAGNMTLHLAVSALQYASAKARIERGLADLVLVERSLEQLPALSDSDTCSFEDSLTFVGGVKIVLEADLALQLATLARGSSLQWTLLLYFRYR